ncbi:MAG TPA: holo-ACP synthase [Candidatus Wallbacteria bacterium]|nr:holo-ACP synthase [Candidatus Wallbacteria bacterium]
MIYGTGIDLVKISRMNESLNRTEGFAGRVFTPAEVAYSSSKAYPAQHFAANFAVKEAFIKAFKMSLSNGMKFHDFELLHDETGMPYIHLSGATKKLFDEKKLSAVHVSISHDADYAIATIVIEGI